MATSLDIEKTEGGSASSTYQEFVINVKAFPRYVYETTKQDLIESKAEFFKECIPSSESLTEKSASLVSLLKSFIHVPYFPAFHRPGWLLRYITGPYDSILFQGLFMDVVAGITVGIALVPQALSYATLANLPPIVGLYASVLPAAAYIFFGSSLTLMVSPVILVSLLVGTLMNQYRVDYVNNPQAALDFGTEAALAVGILLTVMGVLNLGFLIHYVSHPVMSGFTTAAAMLIGLSLLKNAAGFTSSVPSQGQVGYDYNWQVMQWYAYHWNDVGSFPGSTKPANILANGKPTYNSLALKICFGIYAPLMFLQLLKWRVKETPERKQAWWYRSFNIIFNFLPFFALLGATIQTSIIKNNDNYQDTAFKLPHDWDAYSLKILGSLTPGLNILHSPTLRWPIGQFIVDCWPITLVAFMESYAVANRMASDLNQLHLLNPSQEMWALGIGNMLGSISSGYPVAGSFGRSALNVQTGASTPFSKITTLILVIVVLPSLTQVLYFVPYAALSAVIFLAIANLLRFSDFWECWKHSKSDLLVMVVTFAIVFIFDTAVGLAVGIPLSGAVYLFQSLFSPRSQPHLEVYDEVSRLGAVLPTGREQGVQVVVFEGDIAFLHADKIRQIISKLVFVPPPVPDRETQGLSDFTFNTVARSFDKVLNPSILEGTTELPSAIVLDFKHVRVIDITGLRVLTSSLNYVRKNHVPVVIINTYDYIAQQLSKYGVKNDDPHSHQVDLSAYHKYSSLEFIPSESEMASKVFLE